MTYVNIDYSSRRPISAQIIDQTVRMITSGVLRPGDWLPSVRQLATELSINPNTMLMYGKEASNRKQEIDRQHYTIPNQRPKDKHCGKI